MIELDCYEFIIIQDGKSLFGDGITINQFEDKNVTIKFFLDGSISGKLYVSFKNTDSGEYVFQSLNGNTLYVGPNITSYPGHWEMTLTGISDFDGQETNVYTSNPFKNFTVVKRQLELNKSNDDDLVDDCRKVYAQCLEALSDCYDIMNNLDYKVLSMEASLTDVHNSYYDSLSKKCSECIEELKDAKNNLLK